MAKDTVNEEGPLLTSARIKDENEKEKEKGVRAQRCNPMQRSGRSRSRVRRGIDVCLFRRTSEVEVMRWWIVGSRLIRLGTSHPRCIEGARS